MTTIITDEKKPIKRVGSFDLYKIGQDKYEVHIKKRFISEPLSFEDLARDYPFLTDGLERDEEGDEGEP
jgi:hypothetical protein